MCVCRTLSIRITSSAFVDVESLNTYTSPAPRKMRRRVLHLCLLCTDTHCERVQSACACIAVSRGGARPPPLPLARADATGEPDAVTRVDRRGLDEELEVDEADEAEDAESDRDRGAITASVHVLIGRATATTFSGKEETEVDRSRSRLTGSVCACSRPGRCEVSRDR